MLPGRVPKRVRSRCLRFGAVATIALLIPPRIVAAQNHSGAATTAGSYTVVERPADQLRSTLAPEQLEILEKLNRVDVAHMARLPSLVVPQVWQDDAMAYSPLPLFSAWAAAHEKALIVHQPSQVFGGYERGHLARWGPVSTGRKTHPTPSGLHHLNWKSPGRASTIDPDWYMPWYFNFHNDRGLAFHQYALPGRPASHACIRLLERDAKWLFEWGESWILDERGWEVLDPGTPIWIFGEYDFDAPPPWRSLEWLAAGITLPARPHCLETFGASGAGLADSPEVTSDITLCHPHSDASDWPGIVDHSAFALTFVQVSTGWIHASNRAPFNSPGLASTIRWGPRQRPVLQLR